MRDDQALGGFLANLLGADDTAEGPPYTHTFRPPEPAGYDEHGRPVYDPDDLVTYTFTDHVHIDRDD